VLSAIRERDHAVHAVRFVTKKKNSSYKKQLRSDISFEGRKEENEAMVEDPF